MKISLFYQSLLSDWNHGNAHFLRGVVTELLERGHEVKVYEPKDNWSLSNLLEQHGNSPIDEFYQNYPGLTSNLYSPATLNLEKELHDQDLVIVHEWNSWTLVKQIGQLRKSGAAFKLLFHDTHHRAVSDSKSMQKYDLRHYDGVLAFGEVIRNIYLKAGWAQQAWTWHEAADTKIFQPIEKEPTEGDLVWIGNWGDDERTQELHEFLIDPVKELGLKAKIYGVRYPDSALKALKQAGISYGGWLPNFKVPEVFSRYRVTVHVPRRPYVENLPGIPTIRPFEAMACGIPLISSPWKDAENLFTPGKDFLIAANKEEMKAHITEVVTNPDRAAFLAQTGREVILARHTCSHRVDELMGIYEELIAAESEDFSAHKESGLNAYSS